jgi:predicted dehydrogenase
MAIEPSRAARSTLTGVVIGAGNRGADAYVPLLLDEPSLGRIVGVADPDPTRRSAFAVAHGLEGGACFDDWRALLDGPARADFALVSTPDALHYGPAMAALEAGYHVLLEKPMATSEDECEALVRAAARHGRLLQICHVLRYAPLYRGLKSVLDSGEIGDVVTIQHSENVGYWHYAHSYARGHWRNRAESSPMILAKSCHDMDLLLWFAGADPVELASIEAPTWLRPKNAPEGAPDFCIEGCAHAGTCPYDAVSMYRDITPVLVDVMMKGDGLPAGTDSPRASGWTRWPVDVLTRDTSPEGVEHALRTTRFGRCAFKVGDNDQPASQSVSVRFANDVVASFTMHSTSHRDGRETRIDGTRGSLLASLYKGEQSLRVVDHKSGRARGVDVGEGDVRHGGADPLLFRAFLDAVRTGECPATSADESLWSHRMAFAADRAAREGRVVRWPRRASFSA